MKLNISLIRIGFLYFSLILLVGSNGLIFAEQPERIEKGNLVLEGMSRLFVQNIETRKEVSIPDLPSGLVSALKFSPGGAKLAFVLETAVAPDDAYSIDFEKNLLERWTYSEVGGLNEDSFVEPELIRYETFDEVSGLPRTIPAFYYKPKGEGPFPVLISIHGGSEGQARPVFRSLTQYHP